MEHELDVEAFGLLLGSTAERPWVAGHGHELLCCCCELSYEIAGLMGCGVKVGVHINSEFDDVVVVRSRQLENCHCWAVVIVLNLLQIEELGGERWPW